MLLWNIKILALSAQIKDPPKITLRLPGLRAGLSKGDSYLPGIHPTEGTRFDIHRKSLRPEEYILELLKLNVSSVKD